MALVYDGTVNGLRDRVADLEGEVFGPDGSAYQIGNRLNGVAGTTVGSALVTATGSSTARSLAARAADTVNVKDYGAVGDGIADDTAAIQSAINAAASGAVVFLPPGTYKTTATLSIANNSKACLRGSSKEASIISYTGNGVALQVGSSTAASPPPRINLADFRIVGTASGTAGLVTGVYNGLRLDNVWVTGFTTGRAWWIRGTNQVIAKDCYFRESLVGVEFDTEDGGSTYWPNLITIEDGMIEANTTNVRSLVFAERNTLRGIDITVSGAAPSVQLKRALSWTIEGNYFELNAAGDSTLDLGDPASADDVAQGVTVRNNFFVEANAITYPVRVLRGEDNSIYGNQIGGAHTAFVRVGSNALGTFVGHNKRAAGTPLEVSEEVGGAGDTMSFGRGGHFYRSGGHYRFDAALQRAPFAVSNDRGDSNHTLTVGSDAPIQRFATTLTGNKTIVLSTTGAVAGDWFRVVRTGLGAFTLDVGGLKTIPSATAAFVDVAYNGSAWVLTGYGAL